MLVATFATNFFVKLKIYVLSAAKTFFIIITTYSFIIISMISIVDCKPQTHLHNTKIQQTLKSQNTFQQSFLKNEA